MHAASESRSHSRPEAGKPSEDLIFLDSAPWYCPDTIHVTDLPPWAYAKCIVRIQRLASEGHALRRPEADYLRDGIHELRVRQAHVNFRILYFFHGQDVVILAHGLTKESAVPDVEIERAIRRKLSFEASPKEHIYEETDGQEEA